LWKTDWLVQWHAQVGRLWSLHAHHITSLLVLLWEHTKGHFHRSSISSMGSTKQSSISIASYILMWWVNSQIQRRCWAQGKHQTRQRH
jgi:hypothetical protein